MLTPPLRVHQTAGDYISTGIPHSEAGKTNTYVCFPTAGAFLETPTLAGKHSTRIVILGTWLNTQLLSRYLLLGLAKIVRIEHGTAPSCVVKPWRTRPHTLEPVDYDPGFWAELRDWAGK